MKFFLKPATVFMMVGFLFAKGYAQPKMFTNGNSKGITEVKIVDANVKNLKANISHFKVRLRGYEQSVIGNYYISGDTIVFKPYWPLDKALAYEILFREELIEILEADHNIDDASVEVLEIFPTANILPANTLKFYIQFSGPMSEGQSHQYITLVKNGQDTVNRAFLELQPELWNQNRTIITLWIEPGRIKRDLGPNNKLGPVLENGDTYQLIVSGDWKDANGNKLKKDYIKRFEVAAWDDQKPDINTWEISEPQAGTKQSLKINFPESLDYILLNETIEIFYNEQPVKGNLSISKSGDLWRFIPTDNWTKGSFKLKVESRLEDLTGNNLNRLFDVDLQNTSESNVRTKAYYERTLDIK